MLQKQTLNINFGQGVDKKTDSFQVSPGRFLSLSNSIFDTLGRLTKRNGFGFLASLPDSSSTFLTTFNKNLTAIGTSLQAYSQDTETWVKKGALFPVSLSTLPLIRSNLNQSQMDCAVASNGLICTVWTETGPTYKYAIADSVTGQNIVSPTIITPSSGTVTGSPRVFIAGVYFIIVFTTEISSVYHLQYIAISNILPGIPTAPVDISTSYTPSDSVAWDAISINGILYVAYNTTSGGQAIKVTYIGHNLGNPVPAKTYAGSIGTMFSLTADLIVPQSPIIWISFYDSVGQTGYSLAVDKNLNPILAPTEWITSLPLENIASTAYNGILTLFYEVYNTVAALGGVQTDYIAKVTVTQTGTVGSPSNLIRSLGLASKAILYNGRSYFLTIQSSTYQPTYFLINDLANIITKFAYENGGTYYTTGIPSISLNNDVMQVPYLYKDLIASVNKNTNVPLGTQTAAVYSQTGINLASVDFTVSQTASEIGSNLNLSGGFILAYDGYSLVEQGFFLWPEQVVLADQHGGGNMTAQEYFYQVTYEWTDNQGNAFRSAPSIPVSITLTEDNDSVGLAFSTLRITYKTANPVKIVIYRWSTAQQNYYQVTSITAPIINSLTDDNITYIDTLSDAQILGNNLLYTTGGVIEDIAPPASDVLCLFNNRLWMIDSEDRNLLWFSKQVIESTPVEMSDLLTLYVAPSTGVQGSTGPMTALASMDDKLIIFKETAAYYINGIGPDNTGSNSQYSDPIYITSSVGCTNPQSIALIPTGLMFQSNKGIWILGRDLSTQYIGAPVESYTLGNLVTSVVSVPGTNQVRFSMSTGITLMYDYFVGQWGTFSTNAVSSVIYNDLHTYINSYGQCFQETPGKYIDGGTPVLLSLQTGWMNLAGQQGFERFYEALLLGTYITPFKLNVQFAFDFSPGITQSVIVTPSNYSPTWGGDQLWGDGQTWGGSQYANVIEERIFPNKQKCSSFQVLITEIYDPSLGVQAGAGLTLTGLGLVTGIKRGFRTQSTGRSFG